MALALDPNGDLYAGTSDDALLLRIDAARHGEVVYDFEGNELTAIALRDGRLAVAANNFPKQGAERRRTRPRTRNSRAVTRATQPRTPPSRGPATCGWSSPMARRANCSARATTVI